MLPLYDDLSTPKITISHLCNNHKSWIDLLTDIDPWYGATTAGGREMDDSTALRQTLSLHPTGRGPRRTGQAGALSADDGRRCYKTAPSAFAQAAIYSQSR